MEHSFLKLKPKEKSLAEMYTLPYIYGTMPTALQWSPDGSVLAFLWNEEGHLLKDIFCITREGVPRKITDVSAVATLPVEDDERPADDVAYAETMYSGVSEFAWAPDNSYIAFLCRGDLFTVPAAGGVPERLTTSAMGKSKLKVTRDGRYIMFIMNSNIWAHDCKTGGLNQLTFFSRKDVTVFNYTISPDSQWLGLLVEDHSMFETIRMPDYSPEKEVKVKELKRNNVGKPLSKNRVGIIPVTGGKMARIKILEPGKPEEKKKPDQVDTGNNIRVYGMTWFEDSSAFVIAYSGAKYQEWHLCKAQPGDEGNPVELFTETMTPWHEHTPLGVCPESKHVFFPSYSNGWRHIYRVPVEGGNAEQVTSGEFDVQQFTVPRKGTRLFYSAHAPDPQKNCVYALPLEGGEPKRISPDRDWSYAVPSEDGTRVAMVACQIMVPDEIHICDVDDTPVNVLSPARPEFSELTKAQVKQFSFTNKSDGVTVHGTMTLPASFDPQKKYPVVMSCVYAGQGKLSFGRYNILDNFMANEMGYILIGVDLRASMGYGREFFFGYHKKLGIIDSEELASCADYLKTLPYIDGNRIGIWGGSYGGFLTLMAMCNHPGVFHTGISWKPVTDWRNYWDSYTCPRLTRPEDAPDIYKATSPVFHAEKLEGNLLIVHGMLDDNVLFQDAAWMIQKLIEAGKYFDLMIYPRDNHGLDLRHESLPDCMERIAAYFEEHMGVGPV
jgi:dipeptidyl-peptidase-4